MEKIQVFMIEFFDIDVIKASVETLLLYPNLEINIIENKSEFTDTLIKPYLLGLVKDNKIKRYFAFDENIFNGVGDVVLRHPLIDLNQTTYCIISDGSLSCKEATWLQKQIEFIEEDKNIYACAVSIDLSNMPPGQEPYVGVIPFIHADKYDIIETGHTNGHMLLLRSVDLVDTLAYLNKVNKTFTDCALGAYRNVHNRSWIRIREPLFHRHTWDYFKIPNHPYLTYKNNFGMQRRFKPMRCGYTLYTKDTETRFEV
jgi:hypothetical protein